MILADFTGHRPCDILKALACGVRPMQPVNLRKGTHCFFWMTSSKYFCAARRLMPLMACPVSYVFLKCTRRSTPMALQALLGFAGSREYFTIPATTAVGRYVSEGSAGYLPARAPALPSLE